MADGCGRISEFSKIYRQRAHENVRIGMTPQSVPRLEDIDDMIKQGERVQMSLQRMRDVVFNHHQASIAEPPREAHYRRANGYDAETSSNYGDDMKANGGFAGGDNKTRKRGVSLPYAYHDSIHLTSYSELLHLDDAIAVIAQRPRNGAEVPTVLAHCAMHAVFVSCNLPVIDQ
jgi:hypothetical protein